MAATRLIALHVNKGKTVAQCLADRTDYSQNAAKTNDGEFISSYECDPKTADEEFLLSKRQYQHITGRQQKNNIIAYQIRQSFKPGEITPEEANQVGYETAMRWTKGKHAFIVATHIDKSHMQNIDEKVLYERAKLILSIYREVCWSTIDRANDVCDTLICTYGDSLDGALIYLENFAPDEARERFEERIRSLFETKWIIELVDMAMLKIREYPDKGALYCEIISKAYLNRFKYRESEMLEVLNMERSTYYDRKKEAILLFGLSLWGTAIPKLKDFLESAREEEALCYCEC